MILFTINIRVSSDFSYTSSSCFQFYDNYNFGNISSFNYSIVGHLALKLIVFPKTFQFFIGLKCEQTCIEDCIFAYKELIIA
jgi:hypothetical protein